MYSQALRPKPGSPCANRSRGCFALLRAHRFVAIVAPTIALTGVQGNAVPSADLGEALRFDDGLHVFTGNDPGLTRRLGYGQHFRGGWDLPLGFSVGYRVQHDETANKSQFTHVLDAIGAHAHRSSARAALIGLGKQVPVVEEHALRGIDADMTGSVELRADLPDFGGDILIMINQRILTKRAPLRCARQNHAPLPRTERWHFAMIVFADRQGLELFHRRQRPLNVVGVLRVIGGAAPVILAPLRGCPVFGEGLFR